MQIHLSILILTVASIGVAYSQDSAVGSAEISMNRTDLIARAERFFRGVYDGKPEVIDELASEKTVISYPIFEQLYGKVALRGKDDIRVLCTNFARKWVDRKLTIRDAIVDANKVVLIWGFQASFVSNEDAKPSEPVKWAGISIFKLDSSGKIEKEYGLESQPGQFSQLLVSELTSK